MKNNVNWKTYQIFLSSTFDDLDKERDFIKKEVIPNVNCELKQFYIKVDICDLRQGIKTSGLSESDKGKYILSQCFSQIERCSPLFIGLLGNRYGWKPSYNELIGILPTLYKYGITATNALGKSVTELEMMVGAFAKKNENSIFCIKDTDYTPEDDGVDNLRKFILEQYASNLDNNVIKYSINNKAFRKANCFQDLGIRLTRLIIDKIKKLHGLHSKEKNIVKLGIENFIFNKTINFITPTQDKYYKDILSKSQRLLLWGGEGYGKSSYLCKFYLDKRLNENKNNVVLFYSFDIPDISHDIKDMLCYWISVIKADALGDIQNASIDNIVHTFRNIIDIGHAHNIEYTFIIDSYDKVYIPNNPYYNNLSWIPEYVTILVSTDEFWLNENTSINITAQAYLPMDYSEEKQYIESLGYIDMTDDVINKILKINQDLLIEDETTSKNPPLFNKLLVEYLNDFGEKEYKEFRKSKDYDEAVRKYRLKEIPNCSCSIGEMFYRLISKTLLSTYDNDSSWTLITTLDLLAISKSGLREENFISIFKGINREWDSSLLYGFSNKFPEYIGYSPISGKWSFNYEFCKAIIMLNMPYDTYPDYLADTFRIILNSFIRSKNKLDTNDDIVLKELFFYIVGANDTQMATAILSQIHDIPNIIIENAKNEILEGLINECSHKIYLEWLTKLFQESILPQVVINFLIDIHKKSQTCGKSFCMLEIMWRFLEIANTKGYSKADSDAFRSYVNLQICLTSNLLFEDILDGAKEEIERLKCTVSEISNKGMHVHLIPDLNTLISEYENIFHIKKFGSEQNNSTLQDKASIEVRSYEYEINECISIFEKSPNDLNNILNLIKVCEYHLNYLYTYKNNIEDATRVLVYIRDIFLNISFIQIDSDKLHLFSARCFHLGEFLLKIREYDKSVMFFKIAQTFDNIIYDRQPSKENKENLTMSYYKIGVCYCQLKELDELSKVIEDWKERSKDDELYEKCSLYKKWCSLLYQSGMYNIALKYYAEICDTLCEIIEKGQEEFVPIFCRLSIERCVCIAQYDVNNGIRNLEIIKNYIQSKLRKIYLACNKHIDYPIPACYDDYEDYRDDLICILQHLDNELGRLQNLLK